MEAEQASDQTYSIETASLRDLGALRVLEQVCFPQDAWPLLDLIGVLTMPGVVRLKAVSAGRMIGFVAGDVRRWENVAWIATIGVLPEWRGGGIGAALLAACEARLHIPVLRLCVRTDNTPAIRMYERFGYRRKGEWGNYYQDGAPALVMEKVR
jgi:ribosomal-protein-alanine N-acetyltransferase